MRSHSFASLVLGVFGVVALLSIGNAACSGPTEVDSGSSENAFTGRNPYYGGGYGYHGGHDYAADHAFTR